MEGSDNAVFVRKQHRGRAAAVPATQEDEGKTSEREPHEFL